MDRSLKLYLFIHHWLIRRNVEYQSYNSPWKLNVNEFVVKRSHPMCFSRCPLDVLTNLPWNQWLNLTGPCTQTTHGSVKCGNKHVLSPEVRCSSPIYVLHRHVTVPHTRNFTLYLTCRFKSLSRGCSGGGEPEVNGLVYRSGECLKRRRNALGLKSCTQSPSAS